MNIRRDEIPYRLQPMVEILGMEKFLEIIRFYGGSNIYIPVYSKVAMKSRNRQIAKDYNGHNMEDLRMKYGISEQQLKRVVRKEGK